MCVFPLSFWVFLNISFHLILSFSIRSAFLQNKIPMKNDLITYHALFGVPLSVHPWWAERICPVISVAQDSGKGKSSSISLSAHLWLIISVSEILQRAKIMLQFSVVKCSNIGTFHKTRDVVWKKMDGIHICFAHFSLFAFVISRYIAP